MLKKRIIPKITVSPYEIGQTRKLAAITTKKFERKRVVGSPISLSRIYEKTGADQLLIINRDKLSISDDPLILELVKDIADEISMPVCFGGGIASLNDCEKLFYAGIDKLSINTSAVKDPSIIGDISKNFGSQALCICIDYVLKEDSGKSTYIYPRLSSSSLSLLDWIKKCQDLGAGEINLSCVSRDGSKQGLDFEFAATVRPHLTVPLLLSGGCATWEHFSKAFTEVDVDGVIASTFFTETDQNMVELKNRLILKDVPIRGSLK